MYSMKNNLVFLVMASERKFVMRAAIEKRLCIPPLVETKGELQLPACREI